MSNVLSLVIADWMGWFTGFSPLAVVRYAGLILLPFLYRRATKDGSLKEQILGWNFNLAIVALLSDVMLEVTLWYVQLVGLEKMTTAQALIGMVLGLVIVFLSATRFYYALIGLKNGASFLDRVISR